MNHITNLLDLEDSDIIITGTEVEGMRKTLTLETKPVALFCPQCGFRMHSRGIKKNVSYIPSFKTALNYGCS